MCGDILKWLKLSRTNAGIQIFFKNVCLVLTFLLMKFETSDFKVLVKIKCSRRVSKKNYLHQVSRFY